MNIIKKCALLTAAFVAVMSLISCGLVAPIDGPDTTEELITTAPDTIALQTTAPLETDEPEIPKTVTISMVGDVLLHEKVADSGIMADGSYNYDHMFANVRDHIEKADIALVNQEVILGGRDLGLSGYPNFNGAFEVGDSIAAAGFDIVLHATNHTLDKRKIAVENCMSFWSTKHPEIEVLGIHDSLEDQNNIYVREENGMKIAFLNYTYGTNGMPIPNDAPYIVDILSEDRLRRDIAKAEELADFTVVLPHWGTEYILTSDYNQRYWANIMFQCGADLVIGTHPHVIEPIEMMTDGNHSMLVYYSIGNFINATAQSGNGIANRMVGGIANVTLSKDDEGKVAIADYGVTPIVSHVVSGSGRITTYKLSDYTNELARQNEIIAQDPSFSLGYCYNLVERVFGDLAD